MKKKIQRTFQIEITNSRVILSVDGAAISCYSIYENDFKNQMFKTIHDHSQLVGIFVVENKKEFEEKPVYEEECSND